MSGLILPCGALLLLAGLIGLYAWRLREGYRETMERVAKEGEQAADDSGDL